MGPVLIREMEGVVYRASLPASIAQSANREDTSGMDGEAPLAGIILSSSGFSKQALLQVRSSSVPLAALHVLAQPQGDTVNEAEGVSDADGLAERCVSIVWNDLFGSPTRGLLAGGLEARWVRALSNRSGGLGDAPGRPVIYRDGKPLR